MENEPRRLPMRPAVDLRAQAQTQPNLPTVRPVLSRPTPTPVTVPAPVEDRILREPATQPLYLKPSAYAQTQTSQDHYAPYRPNLEGQHSQSPAPNVGAPLLRASSKNLPPTLGASSDFDIHPFGQAPKEKKKIGGKVILLLTLIVGFVVPVAVLGGPLLSQLSESVSALGDINPNDTLGDTLGGNTNPVLSVSSGAYAMGDRPDYEYMMSIVSGTYDKYADMERYEILSLVPPNQAGVDYLHDFLILLDGNITECENPDLKSNDSDELDAKIETCVTRTREIERKFLAGESFNESITGTNADGTVYISDGNNRAAVSIADAEAYARDFQPYKDADGTYIGAGKDVAGKFNMLLTWTPEAQQDACLTSGSDMQYVIAQYCHARPYFIYVNPDFANYYGNIRKADFVDDIKHEISHHLIGVQCGTSSPSITGDLTEGVTSSYAVRYLGANYDVLQESVNYDARYGMTDSTDAIAQAIHSGQCSASA